MFAAGFLTGPVYCSEILSSLPEMSSQKRLQTSDPQDVTRKIN